MAEKGTEKQQNNANALSCLVCVACLLRYSADLSFQSYGLLLGWFSVLQFLLSGTNKLHKLAHTSQLIGIVTGFIATGILASAFELSRNQHVLLNMPASGNITAVIEHISVRQEEQRMRLYLKLIDSSQPAFKGLSRVRVTTASTELQAGMEIKAHVRLFPLGLPAFSGRPDYARQHYL